MKWLFILFFPFVLFSEIKLLVLVIASDHFPIYVNLQKMWKSYMHLDPEHVEVYFIRANPKLESLYEIQGDEIWSRTREGWSPDSAGIINKTLFSMEAMLPRIKEFDYVLRTNLSSFYYFPRLLKELENLPKEKCYFASPVSPESQTGTGCGYILSPDLVELLVQNKQKLLNRSYPQDDELVAAFLHSQNIELTKHPRLDIITVNQWNRDREGIFASDLFHFRVKTEDRWASKAEGISDDIFIYSQLLRHFYPQVQQ